jgi:alpha-glucosidase
MLQMTLPGIGVIFSGDELGMVIGEIRSDHVRDPAAKQNPALGRDHSRIPIPCDRTSSSWGFTDGVPWLPITQPIWMNAEDEAADPRSILSLYKTLISLRTELAPIREGAFAAATVDNPDVYCYVRSHNEDKYLVMMNFSGSPVRFTTPYSNGELIL